MRPDAGAVTALGQRLAGHRRADTVAPGLRMHHELGHRRCLRLGRGEVQVTDDVIAVDGDEVPRPVVRQFTQNLVAHGRHTVDRLRRGDQLADPALIVVGQTDTPADRTH